MPRTRSYRLSSQFILRVTGFPVEWLRELRAPALAEAIDRGGEPAPALYAAEIERTRRNLRDRAADERFRHALLWAAPGLEARVADAGAPLPVRNSDARHHEHSLALYLQRLTAKNDTISLYGPSAWGRVDPAEALPARLDLDEANPIAARAVYIERWVCEALAERMAHDTGRAVLVPVSALPLEALARAVDSWLEGEARNTWRARLAEIEARRRALADAPERASRRAALEALAHTLEGCGVAAARRTRSLYAARLPVNEDCRRGAHRLTLGRPLVEQATVDLAGWYELWRDLAGLYATRVRELLEPVWRGLGGRPVPIARFFSGADEAGLHFWRNGGTGLAPELDEEVQAAWQEQLGARADAREVALTDEDLSFLRRRFRFERMRAFDLPAPDLQILAADRRAVDSGDWQLLVGEIHPDLSIWEHCFLLWCPAVDELAREYRHGGHAPAIQWGPTNEFGVHILCRAHESAGDWSFLEPLSADGAARVALDEALVDAADGDLIVRHQDGRVLGSLIHHWRVTANTHRFELTGTGPHSPRLRVGRAIVQRESWLVEPDDELRRAVAQVGSGALVALRRLRRERGLPEEIFVRPELPTRLTYHKDIKPIFVDFRSPLLLEVLAGWIRRYLRLRVTEALPRTEDCWLEDRDGHHSFELRLVALAEGA